MNLLFTVIVSTAMGVQFIFPQPNREICTLNAQQLASLLTTEATVGCWDQFAQGWAWSYAIWFRHTGG